jgi:hypothetical protein
MAEAQRPQAPLGQLMDERRKELGLVWREVEAASGLRYETLRAIRFGDQVPRGLTRAQIDKGMRWQSGSTDAFLADGTAPVPASDGTQQPGEAQAAAVLFPGDPVAQAIMGQVHKPLDVRHRELARWLAEDGRAAQA